MYVFIGFSTRKLREIHSVYVDSVSKSDPEAILSAFKWQSDSCSFVFVEVWDVENSQLVVRLDF